MNKDIKEIEESIQEVIEKNEDSIKGFEKAAELSKELGTKSYFENKAVERRRFLKQLHNATPALETGSAKVEGSSKGAVHRSWMDVKAFFSDDNDESMLKEMVRGDKAAIKEYEEVMVQTLVPHRIKEILREQKEEIQNDLETAEILQKFR